MALIKNGTNLWDIKEGFVTQIAPKYFDNIKNLSELNVGLFGYSTEILGNTAKDSFNTITSLFKEMFPTKAELPESIYNHALLFQLSNIFATPAVVPFNILVSEDAIIKASTVSSNYLYFDMDSSAEFNISGINFMLDYDIRIITKQTSQGYVHNAQYIMDKNNTISGLNNPYIRTSIYYHQNNKRYILMEVKLHQVRKRVHTDTIFTNDVVDMVTLNYNFTDQLANFEIYYQAPGETTYTQLKKRLFNTDKISAPFCYYKLADDNILQISFPNDDKYFKPAYNSNIMVEIYTTNGTGGNFDIYEGSSVNIITKSDKYESNRGIIFGGNVAGPSILGTDRGTLEDLRNDTVKAWSTIKSFTTSADLNLYFNETAEDYVKTKIFFMKKRDDAFERLYSAFVLFKDNDENIIPTNTLDARIFPENITKTMEQTHRNVIPAGLVYEYVVSSTGGKYVKVSDITMNDDLDAYEKTDFLYVNPFLTIVCTNPISVAFYRNMINDTLILNHTNITTNSFYQFSVDNIMVKRNSLVGETEYTFEARLSPTVILPEPAMKWVRPDTRVGEDDITFVNPTDGFEYINKQNLRCIIELQDSSNNARLYVELELYGFNEVEYFFKGKLETNDYISVGHDIQMTGGFKHANTYMESGDPVLVPATNCKAALYVLYKNPEDTDIASHIFQRFEGFDGFAMTNKYILDEDNLLNFVVPIEEIRSTVEYIMRDEGGFGFRLSAVPLVKANYLKMDGMRESFINNFVNVYKYIKDASVRLTNNFHIDMKFFNTYGYSEHYYIANQIANHIDKINISLRIDVKWEINSNQDAQNEELLAFVKKFIESTDISVQASPNFYFSSLIYAAKEQFPKLRYMVIVGLNDYSADIQVLESDVNESNIIQGVIETSDVIPEFLNVDCVISEGKMTPQIFIRNIY